MITAIKQQASEPTIEATLPATQSQNASGATILDDAEKAASTTVLLRRVETVDATLTPVMAMSGGEYSPSVTHRQSIDTHHQSARKCAAAVLAHILRFASAARAVHARVRFLTRISH